MDKARVLAIGVRHGATEENEAPTKMRAQDNYSLDNSGRIQIQLLAQKLKAYDPKVIYAAGWDRDVESALILSDILKIPLMEVDSALMTADMGELAGMPEEDTTPYVKQWYQQPWMPAPGAGATHNDWVENFMAYLDGKIELARSVPQFRPFIFVTHGRNLAALDARYNFKLPWMTEMPKTGQALLIYHDSDGSDKLSQIGPTEGILADA
jgi:broad specificity phosphatase PhoE